MPGPETRKTGWWPRPCRLPVEAMSLSRRQLSKFPDRSRLTGRTAAHRCNSAVGLRSALSCALLLWVWPGERGCLAVPRAPAPGAGAGRCVLAGRGRWLCRWAPTPPHPLSQRQRAGASDIRPGAPRCRPSRGGCRPTRSSTSRAVHGLSHAWRRSRRDPRVARDMACAATMSKTGWRAARRAATRPSSALSSQPTLSPAACDLTFVSDAVSVPLSGTMRSCPRWRACASRLFFLRRGHGHLSRLR
jgi:hypothetical protein